MKWFRVLLAIFLLVGMLLCVSSVAYADGSPDEDPGLNVDITVVGDNSDVGVDVIGDDALVTVNTTGTEIYLNGRNINEPTVIHHTRTRTVDRRARQQLTILNTELDNTQENLNLAIEGLAKLIIQVQDQDSFNTYVLQGLDENTMRLDEIDGEISSLHHQFSYLNVWLWDLEGRHNALAADTEAEQAAIREKFDQVEMDYHRKLLIMGGVFLAVVLGLGIGLTRRIHRIES